MRSGVGMLENYILVSNHKFRTFYWQPFASIWCVVVSSIPINGFTWFYKLIIQHTPLISPNIKHYLWVIDFRLCRNFSWLARFHKDMIIFQRLLASIRMTPNFFECTYEYIADYLVFGNNLQRVVLPVYHFKTFLTAQDVFRLPSQNHYSWYVRSARSCSPQTSSKIRLLSAELSY